METHPSTTINVDSQSVIAREPIGGSDFRANFLVMLVTFAVGIVLMGLKFLGYWVTGSAAILSDALESIINVVASGFGLGSIVFSAKPADEDHPYGHGKIEFFSAGFEGALIIAAAVGIFFYGMKQVLYPQELPNLRKGFSFSSLVVLGTSSSDWSCLKSVSAQSRLFCRPMESISLQTFSPPVRFSSVWYSYILQDGFDSTVLLHVLPEGISFSGASSWCGRLMVA